MGRNIRNENKVIIRWLFEINLGIAINKINNDIITTTFVIAFLSNVM